MNPSPPRLATATDRPAMVALWVAAWSRAMPGIDFAARRSWFETHLEDLARTGAVTLVAEHTSGFLAGLLLIDPATGYLDQLAVAPDHQGSGLAARLLGEAKRRAPGRIVLDVNQDNPRAVRFYRREGFATIAAGRNPRSGLPVWRMEWRETAPVPG